MWTLDREASGRRALRRKAAFRRTVMCGSGTSKIEQVIRGMRLRAKQGRCELTFECTFQSFLTLGVRKFDQRFPIMSECIRKYVIERLGSNFVSSIFR